MLDFTEVWRNAYIVIPWMRCIDGLSCMHGQRQYCCADQPCNLLLPVVESRTGSRECCVEYQLERRTARCWLTATTDMTQ